MASPNSPITTVYQCSECDHCSHNLEDATLHAVQAHNDDEFDEQENDLEDENDDVQSLVIPKIEDLKSERDELSDWDMNVSIYKKANGASEEREDHTQGSTSHGPFRRLDMWTPEGTKELINCVQERYSDLKNRLLRKKHIWEEIKDVVIKKVPGVTRTQCEQKWRNLLTSQRKYIVNCKLVGNSRMRKPENFEEISQIVGDDIYKELDVSSFIDSETSSLSSVSKSGKMSQIKRGVQESEESVSQVLQLALEKQYMLGKDASKSNDFVSVLLRLLSVLEKREVSRAAFQKEILDIERTKLLILQKFLDSREKEKKMQSQLLKEWLANQTIGKKRKRDLSD